MSSTAVLLYSSTAVLLYSSTSVLLYSITAVLLYSSTAVLLQYGQVVGGHLWAPLLPTCPGPNVQQGSAATLYSSVLQQCCTVLQWWYTAVPVQYSVM